MLTLPNAAPDAVKLLEVIAPLATLVTMPDVEIIATLEPAMLTARLVAAVPVPVLFTSI